MNPILIDGAKNGAVPKSINCRVGVIVYCPPLSHIFNLVGYSGSFKLYLGTVAMHLQAPLLRISAAIGWFTSTTKLPASTSMESSKLEVQYLFGGSQYVLST